MASNPTVIVGHLDDQELKQSISNLVAHVKRGLKTMETDTTNTVQAMQKSLQSLGNLKLDANNGGDGGSTRRARRQQAETAAVKETQMSYDQLLGSLKAAQREVTMFESKRTFTTQDIDRYKEALTKVVELNEKLAAKQSEAAMARATFVEKHSSFDARATLRDLYAVDDRLKQLNRYYAEQERLSRKMADQNAKRVEMYQTSVLKNAFKGALTMPTNNLDEIRAKIERITTLTSSLKKEGLIDEAQTNRANALVAKLNEQLDKQLTLEREIKAEQAKMNGGMGRIPPEMRMLGDEKRARDSYYAFVAGYKEQANQLSQLIKDEESRLVQAQQARVTALGQNIDQNKAKIQELRDTLKQLTEEEKTASTRYGVKDGYRMAIQQTNDEINKLITKNKELEQEQQRVSATDPLKQQNATLDELRAKRERVLNIMHEEVNTHKQVTEAVQQVNRVQSEQAKYTSEGIAAYKEYRDVIHSTATEIRALQSANPNVKRYFETTSNVTGKTYKSEIYAENTALANGLSIESQILQVIRQKRDEERQYVATLERANVALAEAEKTRKKYITPETGVNTAFNRMLANSLGLTENDVTNTGKRLKDFNNYIKQLEQSYTNLTATARNSPFGKQLRTELQEAQRVARQVKAELSRPVSRTFLDQLPTKTLDDIAYKMQQLSLYRSGLNVDTQKKEIEQVNEEYNKLKKKMDEVMQKNNSLISSNNALGRSWNYMKNRLAFYFTVGASTAFIRNLIEVRSQYEMNERALGILVDSAEHGTRIFKELSDMALVSPYTLIELSNAARQMTAYGTAAKDVVDVTRRVADMASAVGAPIERLTYALGHVQTYGYLTSLQARQFINAGIPIVKELSNLYTQMEGRMVSVSDVYDRMKKKAVSYNDVMQVVTSMTDKNGRFFDFQAKMADTLKVRLANLTLAWNNMLNEIGASSQGVLTTGINALKDLFLQWQNIEKIIKRLVWAFGLYKVAQISVISYTQKVGVATAAASAINMKLLKSIYSLKGAMVALASNWQFFLAMLATYAIVDFFATIKKNNEAIRELNETISKNAEEAAKSIDKFLKMQAMLDARAGAKANTLTQAEGEKAWKALREEIENSSIAASQLIPKLLEIQNINERLTAAFALAEEIRDVEYKLSNLKNELKIDRDSFLFGLFGEGLAEDLEDYQEHLEKIDENVKFSEKKQRGFWESIGTAISAAAHGIGESFGSSLKEAEKETEDFAKHAADVIEEVLGKEGVKSSNKLAEAVARLRKEVLAANPQIRGRGLLLFESGLDKVFAERFDAYDESAMVTQRFLDQLQKDYGSAFNNITTDILDKNNKWNQEQKNAFHETYETLKKDIPDAWTQILDKMLSDLNSRDWTIKVMAKFDVTTLSDVQKDFRKEFIENGLGGLDFNSYQKEREQRERRFANLMRKDGEDNVEYQKRISEEKQKQLDIAKENQDIYDAQADKSNSIAKDAKTAADSASQWLKDAQAVEKWGGYDFSTKKEKASEAKEQKQAETELQKALKDELSIIEKIRSDYDKLRKAGVDSATSMTIATEGYETSLKRINAILDKNGLNAFKVSDFAGKNTHELLNTLMSQRSALLSRGAKLSELKEFDVEIQKLTIDAKVYDTQKVVEGLNNKLDKIKDEYELAVELDADPELGEMFSNMFNINTANFPHTIDEYMKRIQDAFDTARNKLGYGEKLNVFRANEDIWAKWGKDVGITSEALDKFKSKFVDAQNVVKKWAQDTIKEIQTLRYELSDTNDKLALEQKKLNTLQNNLAKATNKEQIKLLRLQIEKQKLVIAKLNEEVLQMLPTYRRLFSGIVEHSAWATRQIAEQWKQALESAKKNNDDTYTITDPLSGEKSTITKKQYGKELERVNGELRKVQTTFEKFNEAFTKGEDGMVDWAQGLSLIASEAEKAAQGLREISSLWESFGYARGDVEVLNDISTTLDSLSSVGKGVGQLMAGDIAGGAVSVISGLGKAIKSWMDNANNRINDSIENSQYRVKKLELAYKDLERAVDDAYGTAVAGAQRATIENKKLQLAELERQLALEKSRDSKHKDDDAIMSLEGSIKDLMKEIEDSTNSIVANLLDVSSVADAVENMVTSVMDALRKGESGIDAWNESIDEMMYNLVKKFAMTHVIAPMVESAFDKMQAIINKDSDDEWETVRQLQQRNAQLQGVPHLKKQLEENERALAEAKARAEQASAVTAQDIDAVNLILEGLKMQGGSAVAALQPLFDRWGIATGEGETTLSALQQGIQGITEETASALEASQTRW